MGSNKFPKQQRLSGRKTIDTLFESGQSGFVYPVRYIFSAENEDGVKPGRAVLVSVSKKHHKRAVKRNLLKRRMREAFRTQSEALKEITERSGQKINIALLYSTKEVVEFEKIRDAVGKILAQIGQRV